MEGQGQGSQVKSMEQMQERCRRFLQEMTQAVNAAPDGHWIEGSEVQAFELIHRFGQEVYQTALQARIDAGQKAAAKGPAAFSPSGGGPVRNKGCSSIQRLSLPGLVDLQRRRYERADGSSVIPIDAFLEQGVRAVSLGVRQLACRLSLDAQSFRRAAENLQAAAQLPISVETLRQVVQEEGKLVVKHQTCEQLEFDWTARECQTARPDGSLGSRVYLSSDGVLISTITRGEKQLRRKKARAKRKKLGSGGGDLGRLRRLKPGADQRFKEFKLVTLYDQERAHQVVMATRGDHRHAGRLMRRMAGACGLRQAQESLAVIDGAPWILRQIDRNVPYLSGVTLDFYHFSQHVHQARIGVWGQEAPEGKAWAQGLLHTAKHEGYQPLWEKLMELRAKTRSPAKRGAIDDLMHYLSARQEMVNYPQNQQRGWDIGSGPMESMCKAMTRRLKGRGMRWDADNAEAMMALEGLMQSQHWSAWWQKRAPCLN